MLKLKSERWLQVYFLLIHMWKEVDVAQCTNMKSSLKVQCEVNNFNIYKYLMKLFWEFTIQNMILNYLSAFHTFVASNGSNPGSSRQAGLIQVVRTCFSTEVESLFWRYMQSNWYVTWFLWKTISNRIYWIAFEHLSKTNWAWFKRPHWGFRQRVFESIYYVRNSVLQAEDGWYHFRRNCLAL